MDLLTLHLKNIKVPTAHDKVYKDECLFSFDNPETDTGLYVSLTTFFGFGRDFVEEYFRKTGNAVYLHIRRERHEVPSQQQGDGPERKITRLAIGVEGGFKTDQKKFDFTDSYSVVVLPSFTSLSWPDPNFPEIVRLSVQSVLDVPSATKLAELESLTGTWDGEARIVSKHAHDLKQLDNGKRIPPQGWQCENCDLKENLWLNLTDGSIMCGRRYHDGTGGNNHAVGHYEKTGYPLAVKLGTITKEGKGDVFSYNEDEMVEDPKLAEHLAHWGINVANLEKTEKSMVELELDLNQRVGEWAALQESSGQLKPLYGPGYTGMVNLGNSCYLNSVMQMLFVVPDFVRRYYDGAPNIFKSFHFPADPADDFNVQMAKLGVGLLSGKYSRPPPEGSPADEDPIGVSPHMFKNLIGKGHPEFSTKKQQDAQEFLSHIVSLLDRHSRHQFNPSTSFQFKLEERVQCSSSKKVKYTHRTDWYLPLNIPLEAAINKEEVNAYEAKRAELELQGKRMAADQLVRPRIKLFSCLEAFMQTEIVEQFYSTALQAKTTARKTTRLSTFPDYLIIQLKKFTLREDWVPIKLDVAVEMPDVVDFSQLRGGGPQPGEEPLPELIGDPPPAPPMDERVLAQLADMGFPLEACKRAIFFTKNSGLETATAWIMEHISDSDLADPFIPPGTESASGFVANPEALPIIMSMGFTQEQATKALKATNNNIERAADWIFSHQEELDNEPSQPEFRDGEGRYKLVAFLSHMGTSSMVGHYVCHILRDGHWVIYNDCKVALSENPPKELGYIYLYERM